MYNNPLNKLLKPLALMAGLIIVLAVGWAIYRSLVFRLVSTDPKTNDVALSSPFFKLSYSQKLAPGVKVQLTPSSALSSYTIDNKIVTVYLNYPLNSGQKYSLTVSHIVSASGKRLADESFNFSPRYIPGNQLSKDQQAALEANQIRYRQSISGDKLIQLLPFTSGGNEFKIDYQVTYQGQKPLATIIITSASQQGQSDALAWIRSIGADPAKYHIQYQTAAVQ